MHSFYKLPPLFKWAITLCLVVIFLCIVLLWFKLITIHFAYYFLVFLIAPLYHFTLTPLMTILGVYTYLSPMLLVYGASEKQYDLHNGTGFDYFLHMRKTKPGKNMRRQLLIYYLEGLLNIIDLVETGKLPSEVIIKGTSYFFSESTARRFGFEIMPASKDVKMNLYLNYFEILWMYSLGKGKFAFPKLNNALMAQTTGMRLVKFKNKIILFHQYLLR